MAEYRLYNQDNITVLEGMEDNSIDAIVTDAPYGLGKEPNAEELIKAWLDKGYMEIKGKGFMGKEWDAFVPQPAFWKLAYRKLKPGGYVLCFFGTRTYDWGVLAMRLAGFEIRDCIQWIYGSGFPESLDVSKAIDDKAGAVRDRLVKSAGVSGSMTGPRINDIDPGTAVTPAANLWNGYGTALKPAYEPICVARKPLDGTVAGNVLKHECGAINLDGCRIPFLSEQDRQSAVFGTGVDITGGNYIGKSRKNDQVNVQPNDKGRFPSNIILDEASAATMDEQSGQLTSGKPVGIANKVERNTYGKYAGGIEITGYGDTGGASRFFYCAKASRADRDYGCEGMEFKEGGQKSNTSGQHITRRDGFVPSPLRNNHPTVKPISLMRYLVRLVKTPFETCTIADFFTGSGTTGVACMLEGVNFIGCDDDEDSYNIAKVRIEYAKQEYLKEQAKPKQGDLFA